MLPKPNQRPTCPHFGSGPTAKPSAWNIESLKTALVGRSHRSLEGKAKLSTLIEKMKTLLEIPKDYKLGIISGSATGAMESALWSLLGPRGVDVFSFDIFGKLWAIDIIEQLKLKDVRVFEADFGHLPKLDDHQPDRDVVFTWNGTTSGTYLPNADWVSDKRTALTICDATSAAFCVDLPWEKLDVTAFSWQKGLGSEAGHGVIILSPKAVERLQTYTPPWPLPRLFRLTYQGHLIEGIFRGETINTPSMLCVEDCLQALEWGEYIGGLTSLVKRCQNNFQTINRWVKQTDWVEFMARDLSIASPVSVCLILSGLKQQPLPNQRDFLKSFAGRLSQEQVAFDIVNHMYAPPSLRIWCGPTVEAKNIELLLPWIEWAYQEQSTFRKKTASSGLKKPFFSHIK
jgi:phosphoserine aminotransferase